MTTRPGGSAYNADDSGNPPLSGQGDVPLDSFGNRLMLARAHARERGILHTGSIREAADLCGFGRGAWTNWERGARPLELLAVVRRVSEYLDVSYDWLLYGGPLDLPPDRLTNRGGNGEADDGEHGVLYLNQPTQTAA